MNKLESIKNYAQTLGLKNTYEHLEHLVHSAEQSNLSYVAFLEVLFKDELKFKQDKARAKRVKEAGFPYPKLLDDFDLNFCDSISIKQFNQLKELTWIDGLYNLILSGPPGTGKSHMGLGLAYHACDQGYKVSYTSMQSLVQYLRTEEIDRRSKIKMNRIRKSHLLVIDEVGYLPISSIEGNLFFQLISELQEQTSIIITTNKGFEEWTEFLGDAALATAILDRISYRCDRIQMSGKSYRLENRKSFLNNEEKTNEI